jgi:hypothetical protein
LCGQGKAELVEQQLVNLFGFGAAFHPHFVAAAARDVNLPAGRDVTITRADAAIPRPGDGRPSKPEYTFRQNTSARWIRSSGGV